MRRTIGEMSTLGVLEEVHRRIREIELENARLHERHDAFIEYEVQRGSELIALEEKLMDDRCAFAAMVARTTYVEPTE